MSDELREIVEAATPGPWEARADREKLRIWHGRDFAVVENLAHPEAMRAQEDARFIATFNPERVKAMLDVIEAARLVVDSAIEPEGYGLTRPLADALAALDSPAPLREGAKP